MLSLQPFSLLHYENSYYVLDSADCYIMNYVNPLHPFTEDYVEFYKSCTHLLVIELL